MTEHILLRVTEGAAVVQLQCAGLRVEGHGFDTALGQVS